MCSLSGFQGGAKAVIQAVASVRLRLESVLLHIECVLLVAFKEALQPSYKQYAHAVVANAQVYVSLCSGGYLLSTSVLVFRYTLSTHSVLVSLCTLNAKRETLNPKLNVVYAQCPCVQVYVVYAQ